MLAIPAIDILGGKCARLQRGEYDSAQIFADNPAKTAREFFSLGAKRLHLVDLDAAKSGGEENAAAVAAVLATAKEFGAEVQTGGGLRTLADVRRVLDAGASYAIVGTAAVRDSAFRHKVISEFPQQILLAMDAREGRVAVAGWCEESGVDIGDFLESAGACPPAGIVFTDIGRDGMLSGVNVQSTAEVAQLAPCPVIASGGVRDQSDLDALQDAHPNIFGAVIGRAAYQTEILKPMLAQYG